MIQPWKQLNRRVLFKHPRLTLLEDTVELPNSKKITYFLAAPPLHDSVSVIAISNDQQILIQQQYSYPVDMVLWELPGGSTELGETIEKAAIRELAEETKYKSNEVKVIGSYFTQNRFKAARQYVVICKALTAYDLKADESEFIETKWVSRKIISAMIKRGEIININMLASIALYDEYITSEQLQLTNP